jgi:tryptophanyl-tRNA synthetase
MRILSGIQPTGQIHIGNYLGAIKHWVDFQNNNECIFFISDLHSLTIPYNPLELQKKILQTAIEHLSVGIDPEKSILFVQSQNKEHTELMWLLNTICPVGELLRMTQYKEKSQQFKNLHTKNFSVGVNAGLLNYPILMASDILLYQAEAVPVGQDQKQHLELTRTLAQKFNKQFGETFKIPEPKIPKIGAKIMALNNPKKKMSKSDPNSCLFVFDDPKIIKKKIMSAVTDTGKIIKHDVRKKPGISNLLTIYSLFSGKTIQELEKQFEKKGYADFKKSLAEIVVNSLEPFRRKKTEFEAREIYVEEMLLGGAKRAQIIAQSTMLDVRKKMGL